jgi:tRNA(Ile)-lysidine synthase
MHYKRLLQLAQTNQSNKIIELPEYLKAYREYDKLILTLHPQKRNQQTQKSIELTIPGKTKFAEFNIEAAIIDFSTAHFEKFKKTKDSFIEWFDLDKLSPPLTVRTREPGDRFIPLGLKKEKKLGQFLTDARIPHNIRSNMLVISDMDKIVWVWPVRISSCAAITNHSRQILQLLITGVPNS